MHAAEPFLADIQNAAGILWKLRPAVRAAIGELDDAKQQAVAYCLHYGDRYWDGLYDKKAYYCRLARHGVWAGIQNYRKRLRMGFPRVIYEPDLALPHYCIRPYSNDEIYFRMPSYGAARSGGVFGRDVQL